jgi:hypothetical protein
MDDMDEEARLAAVFRDAAADAPPPGFDAADVVTTSRRITRRRRSMLAGAGLAVLAVVGVGVTAGLGGGSGSQLTTASAGSAQDSAQGTAQDVGAPEAARAAAPEPAGAPDAATPGSGTAAGGSSAGAASDAAATAPVASGPAGSGAPLGPGTGECANRQDPALRALVEQVLPEVVGAPAAATTQECRPGGERGLALEVRDGATSGVLSVTYLPAGTVPRLAPGARSAPTASGGTVLVSTGDVGGGKPAPFAGRLDAVVAYLAPRL